MQSHLGLIPTLGDGSHSDSYLAEEQSSSETICLGPLSYEGVQLGFRAHLLNRCTTYHTPV